MSFSCDHCGFSNTEVKSAGQIQEKGSKVTLVLDSVDDMERQIVKSDTAVFRIENLDIEMPAGHGRLTNVEGLLSEVLKDLESGQKQRKEESLELHDKIEAIVQALSKMMSGGHFPCSISLDDSSGNSWIEPSPHDKDKKYIKSEYPRTPAQNAELGLGELPEDSTNSTSGPTPYIVPQISAEDDSTETDSMEDVDIIAGKVYTIPTPCPGCSKDAHLKIQLINIPYFKEVIVSAILCLDCNYRSSDIKTGGEIPEKGKRIHLTVRDPIDLTRDILKSETCCLKIPKCNVEVVPGTMGGRFTTVEGLLTQIRDDLRGTIFEDEDKELKGGDSMAKEKRLSWEEFFKTLEDAIQGRFDYEMILEDPLGNSYMQNLNAPEPDEKLREEEYVRSEEENEDLGISDMRTREVEGGGYEREEFAGTKSLSKSLLHEDEKAVENGGSHNGEEKDIEIEKERAAKLIKETIGSASGAKVSL